MATNAFKSIHHLNNSLRRSHPIDHRLPPSSATKTYTFFLKPTTICLSSSTSTVITIGAAAATPTATSISRDVTFDILNSHLSTNNFRAADEETRRLLIVLAGEQAQERGYVFFSETQFISVDDLKTIDSLWKKYSDNKFGYSVQRKIWKKVNKDFTKFFIKVGWMKKLESSEVEQYNYRAFPGEFIWELEEGTPEGHLPLTNALRGTQLLTSIFTHPAFDEEDEEETGDEKEESNINNKKPLSNRTFKPNYSF